jgi:hypothetical protein
MNNKEDTQTQSQMLKAPDAANFVQAQIPDLCGLENMGFFQYSPATTLLQGARLLSSIWSYHQKHHPNGDFIKHKSRLCVDGSQQQHRRNHWDTYAPMLSWSTVHLVLLLSSIFGLRSWQVDYTQAFPPS